MLCFESANFIQVNHLQSFIGTSFEIRYDSYANNITLTNISVYYDNISVYIYEYRMLTY